MTIFLVLGLFVGLCMIWLLFNLAVHALPVGGGISIAFWMRDQDYGFFAAIFGGIVAGIAILLIGQLLFASVRSPMVRLVLALLFAVPAGIAGYHAVRGRDEACDRSGHSPLGTELDRRCRYCEHRSDTARQRRNFKGCNVSLLTGGFRLNRHRRSPTGRMMVDCALTGPEHPGRVSGRQECSGAVGAPGRGSVSPTIKSRSVAAFARPS